MKKKTISIERLVKEAGKETISIEELVKHEKKEKGYKKRWAKGLFLLMSGLIVSLATVYYLKQESKDYNRAKPPTTISESVKKQTQTYKPAPKPPIIPKLNFTYQESLPLEDKILYDVFVKGNSSNYSGSSLDSSLMQCVKNALNPNRNFKSVFDINDNGDVVYCNFVANNVKEKTNILSREDHNPALYDGVIKEKKGVIREGNYNLNLVVRGKNIVVPVPFSMKIGYEGYTFAPSASFEAEWVFGMENSKSKSNIRYFFSKYYQGDVAIDNEYAYIIHNDLDGPTLVKVPLKPYLDGEEHQGTDVSEHIWRKKSLDKNLIPSNFEPSGRKLKMDVDKNNIYVAFRIMPDFEQELAYAPNWHDLLYIAIYNKKDFQLIKKIGGLLGDTSPGVRNVNDLKADGKGRFYVVDRWNDKIMIRDSHGNLIKSWSEKGALPGKFNKPSMVAFDDLNNVYVLDSRNERIQKFRVN